MFKNVWQDCVNPVICSTFFFYGKQNVRQRAAVGVSPASGSEDLKGEDEIWKLKVIFS